MRHNRIGSTSMASCLITNPENSANTDSIRQAKERSYPWTNKHHFLGKVEYFNQINEFKVLTPTLTTSELDCQFEEYIKPKIYNLVRNLKGCCSWLQEGPNTSKTNLIFFFTTSEHGIESHSMGKKLFFSFYPQFCIQFVYRATLPFTFIFLKVLVHFEKKKCDWKP